MKYEVYKIKGVVKKGEAVRFTMQDRDTSDVLDFWMRLKEEEIKKVLDLFFVQSLQDLEGKTAIVESRFDAIVGIGTLPRTGTIWYIFPELVSDMAASGTLEMY